MNAEQILLTIVIGLSTWTLTSVVKLREQLAGLPCRKCPNPASVPVPAGGFPIVTLMLALLLLAVHLSADPVTNVIDQAAAPSGLAVGSRTTNTDDGPPPSSPATSGGERSLIGVLFDALPWQTMFDWAAGFTLPTLLGLWRVYAAKHARAAAIVATLISAVEKSGPIAPTIKSEIRKEALANGVQTELNAAVQKLT